MNISKHSNSASAPFGGGSRAFYTRAAWSRIAGAVAVLFYRTSINLFFFFLLLPSSASSTTLTNSLVLFNFWLNDGWSAIHKPLLLLHTHFLLYICIDRLRFTYVFLLLFFLMCEWWALYCCLPLSHTLSDSFIQCHFHEFLLPFLSFTWGPNASHFIREGNTVNLI